MNPNTKKLIGALVAAALAIGVYYGVIGQQQATSIQNQANQTLGDSPAQQPAPQSAPSPTAGTNPAAPMTPSAAPAAPAPQNVAPAPQH